MFEMLFINALITPFASTPGCEKKFLSSADKKALITFFFLEKNLILVHRYLSKLCSKLMVCSFLKTYNQEDH